MFAPNSSDLNMYSLENMPSTATVLSAYTTLMALAMLVRTMSNEIRSIANQFIPQQLQEKFFSMLGSLFSSISSSLTLVIDQNNDFFSPNQIYEASDVYLSTIITPSVGRLRVSKSFQEKNMSVTIGKGVEIIDVFEGIELKWRFVCTTQKSSTGNIHEDSNRTERRSFELSFLETHKETVLSSYLQHVVKIAKAIKEENKAVKLYSLSKGGSINLNHPSTFETLAMDPPLKKELMDDLDMFVKRRDFYRRVGKAWKRGYLLYGPPGTGKSSLIAAMANYLNFSIYDLDLTNVRSNSQLQSLIVTTANRSILVIEDIDCSVEVQNRQAEGKNTLGEYTQLTMSGLLNFIDGLWSSCGDERIIVFTTNHKERIDPALLRPGRMDKHIHMSYCTPCGFKQLASNYLDISNHRLFEEIEALITEVNVTPAEVAGELMRSDDANMALEGLNKFLERKKIERDEANARGEEVDKKGKEEEDEKKVQKTNKWGKISRGKRGGKSKMMIKR